MPYELCMMLHAYNPSTERWRQEILKFKVILSKFKATLGYKEGTL